MIVSESDSPKNLLSSRVLGNSETGNLLMFMNPLVAIFMLFLLGILGANVLGWLGILGPPELKGIIPGIVLWGMFILGIVFIKRGFFDEARIARRIISYARYSTRESADLKRSFP